MPNIKFAYTVVLEKDVHVATIQKELRKDFVIYDQYLKKNAFDDFCGPNELFERRRVFIIYQSKNKTGRKRKNQNFNFKNNEEIRELEKQYQENVKLLGNA